MSSTVKKKDSVRNTSATLDTQHTNKLYEFQKKSEEINLLKTNLNNIQKEISAIEEQRKNGLQSDDLINKYIKLIDEKEELKKSIDMLEEDVDEVEYLVNTAPILFKYYDIVQNGNNNDRSVNHKNISKNNSILKWFSKEDQQKAKHTQNTTNEEEPVKEDRASLLDKYMSYIDNNYIKSPDNGKCSNVCDKCGSSNINLLLNDGIMYCNNCACIEHIIVDHDRPSYKDPPKSILPWVAQQFYYLYSKIASIIVVV